MKDWQQLRNPAWTFRKDSGLQHGASSVGPGEFWQQPPAQASSHIIEVECVAGGGWMEAASEFFLAAESQHSAVGPV